MEDFDLSFLDDPDAEDHDVEAPAGTVTLLSSNGGEFYIPTDGTQTLGALVEASGLAVAGSVQYWMESQQVPMDQIVPVGAVITALGNVKGGTIE